MDKVIFHDTVSPKEVEQQYVARKVQKIEEINPELGAILKKAVYEYYRDTTNQ